MNHNNHLTQYHHRSGEVEEVPDWYEEVFTEGVVGDWLWRNMKIDEVTHKCLYILIPDLLGEGQGPLKDQGAELLCVYPSHAPNNWAQPGNVNGWDGDEETPTLHPSILIKSKDRLGWHGYLEKGKLRSV